MREQQTELPAKQHQAFAEIYDQRIIGKACKPVHPRRAGWLTQKAGENYQKTTPELARVVSRS